MEGLIFGILRYYKKELLKDITLFFYITVESPLMGSCRRAYKKKARRKALR